MLLETIAGLPQGAIVLPGLDTDLDEPSWRMILADSDGHEAVSHPQFGLASLLRRIGIARSDVKIIASARVAWARSLRVGGAAAGGIDRSLAKAPHRTTTFLPAATRRYGA